MAETSIISYKIKQNEILSRIVAQNYVGADGKAIDLKTQQGKLLSAKLSEALIGQGDNKKVVIPNANKPHSNHIMAGADLSLVEKLDLGDGLTFVRSDVAKKSSAEVAVQPKKEAIPVVEVEEKPVATPVQEEQKVDAQPEEAPVSKAPVVADNPFSLPNLAAQESTAEISPIPTVVPEGNNIFVDSNTAVQNKKEATRLVADRPAPEVPVEPVAESVTPVEESPVKEVSAHPLTYSPGSFKASLTGGDKKPEDIDIPQLGEPEKPEPLMSTANFEVEQDFAANEGKISTDTLPKGGKPKDARLSFDF